ncbi:MAG: phosphorylcholine transferase LicD [Eubacteriales bacterium]
MKPIQDNEIKEIALDILMKIDQLCNQKGWNYSITAGTLIGAIRHKGFIPWDDDIDIMMPRKDYCELIEYFGDGKDGLKVVCCNNNPYYQDVFAKVCDTSTVIEDQVTNINGANMGVSIDIFPVDGLGDSVKQAKKNVKRGKFKQLLMTCAGMKKYSKSTTHSIVYEPIRFALFLITRNVSANRIARKLDKANAKYDFYSSKYAGALSGSFREKTILPREEYFDCIKVVFEGREVRALRGYDAYLRKLYGDYMILPPESQRHTHHTFTAYRVNPGEEQ